ncbi:MAG TPA: trypsin-like serine protease [Streptosporangiaceae bacterium]|nr:trypsin-like serine protease [Streptosporangiaceae bacterium]
MRTRVRHTREGELAVARRGADGKYPERRRRPQPGRARSLVTSSTSLMSIMTLLIFAIVMASPAGTAADSAPPELAASVPLSATSFTGTAAVGALFVTSASGTPTHFCTASVVHSPRRDMVITAAHCLASYAANPHQITFVPGYHDGKAPYGAWTMSRVIVDSAWASASDPDDDVAFLIVEDHAGGRIEDVTGSEQLGVGLQPAGVVRVIGYPNSEQRPVTCQNKATEFSASQLKFECGGFTNGTSGGPFLTDVSPVTGNGLVVGVIGGYELGGYTAAISYSPTFGPSVGALYKSAVAAS